MIPLFVVRKNALLLGHQLCTAVNVAATSALKPWKDGNGWPSHR